MRSRTSEIRSSNRSLVAHHISERTAVLRLVRRVCQHGGQHHYPVHQRSSGGPAQRVHEDIRYERDRKESLEHRQDMLRRYEHTATLTVEKAAEVKQEVAVAAEKVKAQVGAAAASVRGLKTDLHTNTVMTRVAAERAQIGCVLCGACGREDRHHAGRGG